MTRDYQVLQNFTDSLKHNNLCKIQDFYLRMNAEPCMQESLDMDPLSLSLQTQ